ncbi:CHASE3 domain-containing protein [Actinomadura viridis]|uniref:histidine kinase n=1 Tax=Actinomadura viridis TaxID=58110 RepID=A0A931DSG3_9ACTN|nr:sensor histidine kinase [Actinomadura viridis]MBG6093924.1 signal transduction histidine kinase [Actinomadura viridis]
MTTDHRPEDGTDTRGTARETAPADSGEQAGEVYGPPLLTPRDPDPAGAEHGRFARMRLGQWLGLAGLALGLMLTAVLVPVGVAVYQQGQARDVLFDRVDPAALRQIELLSAVGRQDSAIRAYAFSGDRAQLQGYRQAVTEQEQAAAAMERHLAGLPRADPARAEIHALNSAIMAWRGAFAEPLATRPPGGGEPPSAELETQGRQAFVQLRAANGRLQSAMTTLHGEYAERLSSRSTTVYWSLIGAAVAVVLAVLALVLIIRRTVLQPVATLTGKVRAVAHGDLARELDVPGPAELAELASIVDAMRHRLMDEWRTTAEARRRIDLQAEELRRSNAELEQFAYVASHDLQEPLRKVASFCQMIERRYADRLDDRGRQYIDFAVDGAKRMQALINDLLNFSRVGRMDRREESVSMEEVLDRALHRLSQLREDTGAEITHDELPALPGDASRLTQLLQNLVGNAIKFHGDEPPRVHIGVERKGPMWEFSCSDNGIGIDPKYADRIFLVFQRLHPQESYSGTGIGLALCKKIIEHHGGTIWLDGTGPGEPATPGAAHEPGESHEPGTPGEPSGGTGPSGGTTQTTTTTGTTFRWTLPAGDDDD